MRSVEHMATSKAMHGMAGLPEVQALARVIVDLRARVEALEARLDRAEFDVLAVGAELAAHCTDHYEGQGHPGEAAMTELTDRVEALTLEVQRSGTEGRP